MLGKEGRGKSCLLFPIQLRASQPIEDVAMTSHVAPELGNEKGVVSGGESECVLEGQGNSPYPLHESRWQVMTLL